jgi:hypothetical protein
LCRLDQEDGNIQSISTCIKQNFDVEFPLQNLTRRYFLAEKKNMSEDNIKVICTEMGCDGGMVCTGLFYVQGWNL